MIFLTIVRKVFLVCIFIQLRVGSDASSSQYYTNTWAVHIPNVDQEKVNEIARRHGMINLGQVGTLDGYYHFKHRAHSKRMRRESLEHTSRLSREIKVKWVEQQAVKRRVKRDALLFPDPLWNKQWYLHNNAKLFKNYDHNVIAVWKQLNYTGRGVSVSILDDGIEKDHPDLKANYDPDASFDYNSNDPDPQPRPTYNDENRHGTRCAGEVAAVAGNTHCGVGVAYGAKVGGIRMLDGEVTDVVEAHSLSYKPEHIDIYSSSWGPDDDGKTVDGPGPLAKVAFSEGIAKGRGGLGNIFVWASGNGGRDQDNCNCDGYTNSIYTLSISSATEHGTSPWYSEFCASTLASTFSSGSWGMRKIVTTDLHHRCTSDHTGTSASAPLAAGILALALEANPKLTWRDMQHIVVRTSKPNKLKSNDWVTNGVGRRISHRFGYGLLDAKDLVDLAKRWKRSPEKRCCSEAKDTTPRAIPVKGSLTVERDTTGCEGTENHIRYLEHVEVILSLSFTRRGDLTIYITSPQGTRSTLLGKRRMDYSAKGFNNWAFMSTHTWEENPKGKWKLEIENVGSTANTGTLRGWQLRFHGTQEEPGIAYTNCSSECKGGCHGPTARDCSECAHYRSNGVCVNKCHDNEYAVEATKDCKTCSNTCEKCKGPEFNHCTSCKEPKLLKEGICVKDCTDGWFANEGICQRCDPKCLTCSGKAIFCTSCKEDHKLEMNRCVIDCKSNEYVSNDLCVQCHLSCLTCNNGSAWSCTKCGVTTVSREGVTHDAYLHRGMCMLTCPSGFYGSDHQCVPCDTSCKHCKGPLNTDCTSCKDGLVRTDDGTGLCLDNCPSGSSHRISEDTCVKCGSNCSACDPDHPSHCTACGQAMFLWKQKCVTIDACPRGTYPEVQSFRCKYCHPSCAACLGPPTHCTACSGYTYLHGNECKAICPTGTYGRNNKCLTCYDNCSSCFGGGRNECLTCDNGFVFFENSCLKQCPAGMFADKRGRCQPCSLTCEGCSGIATNCTKCKEGFSKDEGACKSVCEDGTFYNSTLASKNVGNKTQDHCSECHVSCSVCSGPSKYDCLRCKGVKFRDPESGLCSLNCPERGYYEDISSTLCEPCPSECLNCGKPSVCLRCVPGLWLHERKCIPHCPKGFYGENTTNACAPCNTACKDCAGSPTSCIECAPPRILFKNECVTACPSGMFLSKDFNRCLPCDGSVDCVGAGRSRCTSCRPGLVLFQAQCRSRCPTRYYFNEYVKNCQPCDYYCKECSGGNGLSNCRKCLTPLVLENNVCVRVCSPGFVLNRAERKCVPCHASCATCMGSTFDQCLSCKDSKDSLQGTVCQRSCRDGMYRNDEGSRCEACHPTCRTCSGRGKVACTSCDPRRSLTLGQCLSPCPGNQYKNKGTCYTCSTGCKTCKGSTSQECLSCHEGKKLFNFTCVKNCPPGTYEGESNGLPECKTCHPSCATCTQAGPDACTSCRMDLYYQGRYCVQECSIDHKLDENTRTCKTCNTDCPYTNITGRRSALLPHQNDDENSSRNKIENHFILISLATCLSLLAIFALFGLFKPRSSKGYTKVENNSASSVEISKNDVPSVYIRDDQSERIAMLDDHDHDHDHNEM
ncbi:LOW QUALITY PROTEIN: proprotein convertase subtilisin/kexin type 5-like [Dendronephthya gigantea]|uniref:LOW QUALITY PROTEIN: proprotein convertase subtilisin/kexin type 5-like n=1 Tax=Dendronephthya gigantea TaxID=151771 RepID=UPI00106B133E|nr:LOW QUALITY PROTEIN: proprotein convertase subtilisin/kexin type 5-like [Dendronephthya gigantea]